MKLLSQIVDKLNRLLYVEPKVSAPEFTEEDIIAERKKAGELFFSVLAGNVSVLEALKKLPKATPDDSINVCFHILVHYAADEDIRKKDPLYRETQDDFILHAAETLQRGEMLPINIINEYNDFYNGNLIYPEINKKTIIARLKKSINI